MTSLFGSWSQGAYLILHLWRLKHFNVVVLRVYLEIPPRENPGRLAFVKVRDVRLKEESYYWKFNGQFSPVFMKLLDPVISRYLDPQSSTHFSFLHFYSIFLKTTLAVIIPFPTLLRNVFISSFLLLEYQWKITNFGVENIFILFASEELSVILNELRRSYLKIKLQYFVINLNCLILILKREKFFNPLNLQISQEKIFLPIKKSISHFGITRESLNSFRFSTFFQPISLKLAKFR